MTPEEGSRKQIECYRQMTPQQRLQIGFEMFDRERERWRVLVRSEHPDWDEPQVEKEAASRMYAAAGYRHEDHL